MSPLCSTSMHYLFQLQPLGNTTFIADSFVKCEAQTCCQHWIRRVKTYTYRAPFIGNDLQPINALLTSKMQRPLGWNTATPYNHLGQEIKIIAIQFKLQENFRQTACNYNRLCLATSHRQKFVKHCIDFFANGRDLHFTSLHWNPASPATQCPLPAR